MIIATIARRKNVEKNKEPARRAKSTSGTELKGETKGSKLKQSCGSSARCDNCNAKLTDAKSTKKENKRLRRSSYWKGAFTDTLDF